MGHAEAGSAGRTASRTTEPSAPGPRTPRPEAQLGRPLLPGSRVCDPIAAISPFIPSLIVIPPSDPQTGHPFTSVKLNSRGLRTRSERALFWGMFPGE